MDELGLSHICTIDCGQITLKLKKKKIMAEKFFGIEEKEVYLLRLPWSNMQDEKSVQGQRKEQEAGKSLPRGCPCSRKKRPRQREKQET